MTRALAVETERVAGFGDTLEIEPAGFAVSLNICGVARTNQVGSWFANQILPQPNPRDWSYSFGPL